MESAIEKKVIDDSYDIYGKCYDMFHEGINYDFYREKLLAKISKLKN